MTCSVINADDPTVRAWADLAEIDENLIRRDRTPAQRANLVAQRKAAYEADHLETKQGHLGAGAVRFAKLATLDRFTADTPNAPKSERAVQRDTTRAKASGPDLAP
jgi:ParB family chromosome partitioning protein